jgi:hypothetical protein
MLHKITYGSVWIILDFSMNSVCCSTGVLTGYNSAMFKLCLVSVVRALGTQGQRFAHFGQPVTGDSVTCHME